MSNSDDAKKPSSDWVHPSDVMSFHRLKFKKKALQARMNRTCLPTTSNKERNLTLCATSEPQKRRNPFIKNDENKKPRLDPPDSAIDFSESSDSTLFKLFHSNTRNGTTKPSSFSKDSSASLPSFTSVLSKLKNTVSAPTKSILGEKYIPIDWTLKHKLRLMSPKPFSWNRTLKTSEEASGITGFVRCLDTRTKTSLDTSPNAQFHQCCLYWQHPSLPWVQLFPRSQGRASATAGSFASAQIKEKLQSSWTDSLRSLFQLVRARQCPYFYVCANTFTACFRAAGICGYSEMHVILTPTTRGFRQILQQEDITFTMPLKSKRRQSDGAVDLGYDTLDSGSQSVLENIVPEPVPQDEDDEPADEQWLESMGLDANEIRQINYTQAKINHKVECEVDNSEQSLIFVEGVEAHGLYNFLINCKSIIATTGPLAGVPPTLLAPVAFHGASLQSLKVRENKIRDNDTDFFSIELSGPILPHTLHNLYSLLPKDCNVSTTFANLTATAPFSKVKASATETQDEHENTSVLASSKSSNVVFGQENLSDCGLNKEILKQFCSVNPDHVQHFDSLKYNSETGMYIWL